MLIAWQAQYAWSFPATMTRQAIVSDCRHCGAHYTGSRVNVRNCTECGSAAITVTMEVAAPCASPRA